jgi:nicotinamide mononucleotide transporter
MEPPAELELDPRASAAAARPRTPLREWAAIAIAALALVGGTAAGLLPFSPLEVFGFVTGGACVWLLVREDVASWPIGLANNLTYLVIFFRARLFADAGLQLVFFAVGVWGWYHWVFRRGVRRELAVARATRREWLALLIIAPVATLLLRELLVAAQGAAPFWDALTTVISLGALALQAGKRIDNWLWWIAADLVYVPLYLSRGLPLTALLYAIFLAMCVVGWRQWRASLAAAQAERRAR